MGIEGMYEIHLLPYLILILGLLSVVGGLFYWIIRKKGSSLGARALMQKMSKELNMEEVQEGVSFKLSRKKLMRRVPYLKGKFSGRDLEIRHEVVHHPINPMVFFIMQISSNKDIKGELSVSRRTSFQRLLGASRPPKYFDEELSCLRIKGSDEAFLGYLFLQDAVLGMVKKVYHEKRLPGHIRIKGGAVTYTEIGLIKKSFYPEGYRAVLELMSCLLKSAEQY